MWRISRPKFKPLITKIHEERKYLDLFFNAAKVAAVASTRCVTHVQNSENRAIGAESLTIHNYAPQMKNRFVRGQDSNREP